jgi:hypothetical protein
LFPLNLQQLKIIPLGLYVKAANNGPEVAEQGFEIVWLNI